MRIAGRSGYRTVLCRDLGGSGWCLASIGSVDRDQKYETLYVVLRLIGSFVFLIAVVTVLGFTFREPLNRFGGWFVARFGVVGIMVGAFLADGIHFPIPPQFYLFTGIAGGVTPVIAVVFVLIGSELGGLAAFAMARWIGGSAFLTQRLVRPKKLLARMIDRQGYFGLAIATLLPVSYCFLCMASGAMCLPYKAYGVLAIMRVPRILLSYFVIAMAWGT